MEVIRFWEDGRCLWEIWDILNMDPGDLVKIDWNSDRWYYMILDMIIRLPETDIAPENRPSWKENYPFAGAMLVSGRGHNNIILQIFRYPRWLVPNNPQQNALRPTARDIPRPRRTERSWDLHRVRFALEIGESRRLATLQWLHWCHYDCLNLFDWPMSRFNYIELPCKLLCI